MSEVADVKSWKICLKVNSKRDAVLEREEQIFDVEQVEVRSCNGGVAKACGSFLYL